MCGAGVRLLRAMRLIDRQLDREEQVLLEPFVVASPIKAREDCRIKIARPRARSRFGECQRAAGRLVDHAREHQLLVAPDSRERGLAPLIV